MSIRITCDQEGVDWQAVCDVVRLAPLWAPEPEKYRRACERSTLAQAYDGEKLVGVARAVSDGEYCAYICDVTVLPDRQGQGIGKKLVQTLMDRFPVQTVILFAAPGKESFYEPFAFRRLKTGMARFANPERMRDRGVIE